MFKFSKLFLLQELLQSCRRHRSCYRVAKGTTEWELKNVQERPLKMLLLFLRSHIEEVESSSQVTSTGKMMKSTVCRTRLEFMKRSHESYCAKRNSRKRWSYRSMPPPQLDARSIWSFRGCFFEDPLPAYNSILYSFKFPRWIRDQDCALCLGHVTYDSCFKLQKVVFTGTLTSCGEIAELADEVGSDSGM